jgi:LEA14-like dessication related protein
MHLLNLKACFIFLSALLLASCGKYSQITIGDVTKVSIKGFEDNALIVSLNLQIDNPTISRIVVKNFDTKLYINNQYLGKLTSQEPIVIQAKSNEVHELVLNVRIANFFGAALNLLNIQSGQKVLFRIEGDLTARSCLMRKKIEINESREVVF